MQVCRFAHGAAMAMRCIGLLAATISALFSQSTAAINGTLVAQDFRAILSQGSGIYLPSDENWEDETTQRWNLWNAPTYVISVKPALVEDVQKIVSYFLFLLVFHLSFRLVTNPQLSRCNMSLSTITPSSQQAGVMATQAAWELWTTASN